MSGRDEGKSISKRGIDGYSFVINLKIKFVQLYRFDPNKHFKKRGNV